MASMDNLILQITAETDELEKKIDLLKSKLFEAQDLAKKIVQDIEHLELSVNTKRD